MKIKDITDAIERYAPLAIQEGYDNSGLLVGDPHDEIASALVCVDITEAVMDEAEKLGAGLVLSHHPVIFGGLKRLTGSSYAEKVVARAIRSGIALYACHTNLDAAPGGLSHRMAEAIGLRDTRVLLPSKEDGTGFGVEGRLEESEPTLEFLSRVAEIFSVKALRHSVPATPEVGKVAVCSGSGASLIDAAKAAGADVYIAADLKYNNFLDAAGLITVADIGHFESEYCAVDVLFDIITKNFPTCAVRKSLNGANPVNYIVTI